MPSRTRLLSSRLLAFCAALSLVVIPALATPKPPPPPKPPKPARPDAHLLQQQQQKKKFAQQNLLHHHSTTSAQALLSQARKRQQARQTGQGAAQSGAGAVTEVQPVQD